MKGLLVLSVFQVIWLKIDVTAFTNPIALHSPDPWMQYYDGYYYLAASTFNTYITMRKSKTLGGIHSATAVRVFNLTSPSGCCHMWAPEFHLLNSTNGHRWYMYYTAGMNVTDYVSTQRIHVLESEGNDPMGPYYWKADLRDPHDDLSAELDSSILKHNGNLYLLGSYIRGKPSLFIRPMSNPWTPSGPKVKLSEPTHDWETKNSPVNEGPEALYHNGKTFIVYSASSCSTPDYKLGMLTLIGSDPLNSSHWAKSGPVFQHQDTDHVYGPGHNGFFLSPDEKENWIVYHANDALNGRCDMNRNTRAQKFTWNPDGTPNFGHPVEVSLELQSPSGE